MYIKSCIRNGTEIINSTRLQNSLVFGVPNTTGYTHAAVRRLRNPDNVRMPRHECQMLPNEVGGIGALLAHVRTTHGEARQGRNAPIEDCLMANVNYEEK